MSQISNRNNLFLIGMMGSWKSTVGRLVSEIMARKFIDTDTVLEELMKMSVPQIFQHLGEERFRTEEIAVIKNVSCGTNQIVATGGGAVLREINRNRMKSNGYVIFMNTQPEILAARIRNVAHRPVLHGSTNLTETLRSLWEERKDQYRSAAHFVIQTDDYAPEDLARSIHSHLLEQNVFC